MTDTIHNTILPMTDTTAEPEDYTGEDGLLYRQSATASGQPVRNGKPPRSGAATLKRWNG